LARAGLAGLLGWLARGWLALHPFARSLSGKNNKKKKTVPNSRKVDFHCKNEGFVT
jgi:hypothetical protein